MYKKRMLIDFDSTSTNNLMIDFHIYNLLSLQNVRYWGKCSSDPFIYKSGTGKCLTLLLEK